MPSTKPALRAVSPHLNTAVHCLNTHHQRTGYNKRPEPIDPRDLIALLRARYAMHGYQQLWWWVGLGSAPIGRWLANRGRCADGACVVVWCVVCVEQ